MRWAALALMISAGPAWSCSGVPEAGQIPGSLVTGGDGDGITKAWYEGPTDIYGHDIMGQVQDATVLMARSSDAVTDCGTLAGVAGEGHVFEDTAPRLADVDGDGQPEVIAVRSSLEQGAQLVVYRADADGVSLTPLVATPYIGRRHRWLAPAAIGDLDGDGYIEIAYVDRPHLAKTLRIWRYADGTFLEVASAGGLTNHAIGDEVIHGGLRDCGQGPEIVLSTGDRTLMLAVTYDGATIVARDIGLFTPAAAVDAVACR